MSNQGKIVQIIGAVVDVEFPRDAVPRVYDALKVDNTAITLEVQQQLGDGVVRTIALGSTDGADDLDDLALVAHHCVLRLSNAALPARHAPAG